jgi:hypothetical protein
VAALTDAAGSAAGSTAEFGCVHYPTWGGLGGPGSNGVELCIPWQDMAGWAAPVRFVFLAVVLIAFAVAFVRLARRAAGSGG